MEMEFVVVASSEVRPPGACLIGDISPVDIGPGRPREGQLKLMAIETDKRGISKRIDAAEQAVEITEWLAYEPKWRTVFTL